MARASARTIVFLLAAWSTLAIGGRPACAQNETSKSAPEPVASAREALQETADFPWYDAEKDAFQPIELAPEREDNGNRKSRWEGAKVSGPAVRPANPFSGLVNALVWMLVVLLIVLLVAAVVWAFLRMENKKAASSSTESSEQESLGEADRIENLPFRVARPQSDLLAEARRHYEAGRYGEAVIYLFSYQLVQLDRHQLIRLTKGKTNRQYLREIRPRAELRTILERTMIAFEDVFFGRRELERERFETCWTQLDAFHQHLQHSTV